VEQPKGSFAGYVRNVTDKAVTLKFPLLRVGGKRTRMGDAEYARVRDDIRARYAVHYTHLLEPPAPAQEAVERAVEMAAPRQGVTAPAERTQELVAPDEPKPTNPAEPPKAKKWPM